MKSNLLDPLRTSLEEWRNGVSSGATSARFSVETADAFRVFVCQSQSTSSLVSKPLLSALMMPYHNAESSKVVALRTSDNKCDKESERGDNGIND